VLSREVSALWEDRLGWLRPARRRRDASRPPSTTMHLREKLRSRAEASPQQRAGSPVVYRATGVGIPIGVSRADVLSGDHRR
jgi:hypothetical protein